MTVRQAVFGLYMGSAFAPNHKGMPVVPRDVTLDFLRRQVLTSRNVRGGWFTDQLLGGLNYQVEHHLFPNMPRGNLRRAQAIVRQYCAERAIQYTETSLFGSYAMALRHLHALGAPLRARAIGAIRGSCSARRIISSFRIGFGVSRHDPGRCTCPAGTRPKGTKNDPGNREVVQQRKGLRLHRP